MNEYKTLTACKIYLVMVGMVYKKSLKREGSAKVSAFHFILFNRIHSPLLLCFIPPLSPFSLPIMQTHSLISNSERWLYLRTTERQTIRDFSRPQRNPDENRKIEEERRNGRGGVDTVTKKIRPLEGGK